MSEFDFLLHKIVKISWEEDYGLRKKFLKGYVPKILESTKSTKIFCISDEGDMGWITIPKYTTPPDMALKIKILDWDVNQLKNNDRNNNDDNRFKLMDMDE